MVPETGDNPPGRTKSSVSLSRPARNERGESRREGELLKSASSPRPSPPFLRRRGREDAVARSKQIFCRRQLTFLSAGSGDFPVARPSPIFNHAQKRRTSTILLDLARFGQKYPRMTEA